MIGKESCPLGCPCVAPGPAGTCRCVSTLIYVLPEANRSTANVCNGYRWGSLGILFLILKNFQCCKKLMTGLWAELSLTGEVFPQIVRFTCKKKNYFWFLGKTY